MAKSPLPTLSRAKGVAARSSAKTLKPRAMALDAISLPAKTIVAPPAIDQDSPTVGFFFDAQWYLERYPDVAAAGVDAADHFMTTGFREGRDPNPVFNTRNYFSANPDLSPNTINPFLHYILYGAAEKRRLKPA